MESWSPKRKVKGAGVHRGHRQRFCSFSSLNRADAPRSVFLQSRPSFHRDATDWVPTGVFNDDEQSIAHVVVEHVGDGAPIYLRDPVHTNRG
ncbi:MAG TPA: hypothetical protein VKU19_32720 [Bryobacteraceae bacterium]|nr:hypothetical protein [Bryobacteraceae bacterium]